MCINLIEEYIKNHKELFDLSTRVLMPFLFFFLGYFLKNLIDKKRFKNQLKSIKLQFEKWIKFSFSDIEKSIKNLNDISDKIKLSKGGIHFEYTLTNSDIDKFLKIQNAKIASLYLNNLKKNNNIDDNFHVFCEISRTIDSYKNRIQLLDDQFKDLLNEFNLILEKWGREKNNLINIRAEKIYPILISNPNNKQYQKIEEVFKQWYNKNQETLDSTFSDLIVPLIDIVTEEFKNQPKENILKELLMELGNMRNTHHQYEKMKVFVSDTFKNSSISTKNDLIKLKELISKSEKLNVKNWYNIELK